VSPPINEDGLITGPRRSDTPNIIQGRSMEWVRKMFGFDTWEDQYQGKNFFVGTFPYPGSSRFNEDELLPEVVSTPGSGGALQMIMSFPPRGTIRWWMVVSFTTDDIASADHKFGYQFNGTNFLVGGNPSNDDDPFSMQNFYCCRGLMPVWTASQSTVGKTFVMSGLFIDFPEGEVPSFPAPFALGP